MIDASVPTGTASTTGSPTSPGGRTTILLAAGVAAGPLYVTVSLAQALTRAGFDLRRHPWSALANGDLGWIQVANLMVTGVLVIGFALGLRRVLAGGPASTWAPRLIGVYGASLVGAGLFRADPVPGFPVGTPASTAVSGSGMAHLAVGATGFLCLTTACLLLARRLWATSRGWAAWTAGAGIVFLAAFVGIAAGAGTPATVQGFVLAVIIIWSWLTSYAIRLLRTQRSVPS